VIWKPTAKTFEQYYERNRTLLNQIFKPLHAETADIDLAFAVDDLLRKRLADGGGVFKSMAGARRRNHDAIVIRVNVDDEVRIGVVVYRQLSLGEPWGKSWS